MRSIQRMVRILVNVAAFAVVFALVSSTVFAATGVVRGRVTYWNGLYLACQPSVANDNCAGHTYPYSEYGTAMGAAHVVVQLLDVNENVLGQGVSDVDGDFTISWTSSTTTAYINWRARHSSNRYEVETPSGGKYQFYTGTFTLTSNTTTQSPQQLGTYQWGSSASPSWPANLYGAVTRVWDDAFDSSNRMLTYFIGLEVRAFTYPGSCSGSCAFGSDMRVYIADSSDVREFDVVMHEMGHIASFLSNPGQERRMTETFYNRDGDETHSMTSAEHAAASFEEGYATFIGSRAIYYQAALQPNMYSYNLETYPVVCYLDPPQSRWELTVGRFLRDLYDTRVDFVGDDESGSYFEFFDSLANFQNDDDNRGKNEPYNMTGIPSVDDRDGRSGVDFREAYEDLTSSDVTDIYTGNCSPYGD